MKYIYDDVYLKLNEFVTSVNGWLPYYIFDIYTNNSDDIVGKITFRLGDNIDNEYAGHIGYTIYEEHRGNNYAYKACLALKDFIISCDYNNILITCSSNNIASQKTIEKLGCKYITTKIIPNSIKKEFGVDEIDKMIYRWQLKSIKK